MPKLYFVLEFDGEWDAKNRTCSLPDPDSGGYELLVIPGFQVVTEKMTLEAAVKLPGVIKPNGNRLSTQYSTIVGLRINF